MNKPKYIFVTGGVVSGLGLQAQRVSSRMKRSKICFLPDIKSSIERSHISHDAYISTSFHDHYIKYRSY